VQIAGGKVLLDAIAVRHLVAGGLDESAFGVLASDSPYTGVPSVMAMRSSLVEQVPGTGVVVAGSVGLVEAVAVRDVPAGTVLNQGGGVFVQPGYHTVSAGALTLRGSSIERVFRQGVLVDGSVATIDSTAVREVEFSPLGEGRGLSVQQCDPNGLPSNAVIRSCLVDGFLDVGVFISGASALVESTEILAQLPGDSGGIARGINIQNCATSTGVPRVRVSSVRIEDAQEAGIFVHDAQAAIEGSLIRDTLPHTTELLGDGIAVFAMDIPARAHVRSTHIDDSARAGISSFGAHLRLVENALTCQIFDVNGEPYSGQSFAVDDLGGNLCGCPDAAASCLVVSAGLEPPPPREPTTR
jgi:hypothetical protein